MRWGIVALVALVVVPVLAPGAVASTFYRNYEATATVATGSGTEYTGFAPCMGGQDTLADTGACVAYYVPGVFDGRGMNVLVTITDVVFGPAVWAIVVVDMNGDGRADCATADLCFSGAGAIAGYVPLDAAGTYLRVFPATAHTDGSQVHVATRGVVEITFY